MLKKTIAGLSLLSIASVGQAAGIDASLSNESAAFNYVFDSSRILQGGADITLGVFYNDKKHRGAEADAILGQAKFMVTGNMKGTQKRVSLSAGAKVLMGEIDSKSFDGDVAALAIGLKAAYLIPSESTPMAAYVEAFVAPGITSFADTENYREFSIGFEAEIAPSAKGYIGYRLMEAELDRVPGDVEVDDNVHIGLVLTF